MRKFRMGLMALVCVAFLPLQHFAQSTQEKRERIQASYMLAFGRQPNDGELNYWLGQPDKTVAQHLQNHRQYASADKSFKRALIIKSYKDALGRNPNEGEVSYWMNGTDLYIDLTQKHVQYLAGASAEYEAVIKRSYQYVLNRQPSTAEISYWKSQGTFSYMILVGCHEQWKRANGQTAQKTSGTNSISSSPSLQVVPLSARVANEARAAAGFNGGNVIAAGSANAVAAGGANVVAAGGANVVAAGGLN